MGRYLARRVGLDVGSEYALVERFCQAQPAIRAMCRIDLPMVHFRSHHLRPAIVPAWGWRTQPGSQGALGFHSLGSGK